MNMKSAITSIVLTLLCFIGLLIQVTEVTRSYLEYRIRRVIKREFPFQLDPPAMSICLELAEVIPMEAYGTFENSSEFDYWKKVFKFISVTPIKELFKLTPKVNQSLKKRTGCSIRFPSELTMSFLDRDDCYNHFRIEKYIQREFMCYKFTPNTYHENDQSSKLRNGNVSENGHKKMGKGLAMEYLMAPAETGVVYALYLNSTAFSRAKRILSFAHGPETDQFEDSFIASQYSMAISETKGTAIKISYQQLTYHRLESPYPSNCYKISNGTSMTHIFADMMNADTIKQLNRLCPMVQLYEHSNYTNYSVICDQDFANLTFREKFNEIIQKNNQYYMGCACDLATYVSSITTQLIDVQNGSDYKFFIYITWPELHSIDMSDEPLQKILDLLIYVASSLGFWFGFSVLSTVSMVGKRSMLIQPSKSRIGIKMEERIHYMEHKIKDRDVTVTGLIDALRRQQNTINLLEKDDEINKQKIRKLMTLVRKPVMKEPFH